MHVTPMTETDSDAVAALSAQLGYPQAAEMLRERFQRIISDPHHKLWVAKDGATIIGWLHAHRAAESMINPPIIEIAALVVDEKARGSGAGKALLRQAEEWARSQGMSEVRLHSNMQREHAHAFYARQGYERRKIWGVFFKPV